MRYEAHMPGLEFALDVVPLFDEMLLNMLIERIMLSPLVTERVKVMGSPLIASSKPKGSLKKHLS